MTEETQQALHHNAVAVREEVGTWRAANKPRNKGRKGQKLWPQDHRGDVWKIPVDKIKRCGST